MAEETDTESLSPEGYRWKDLESQNAASRLEQYKLLLIHLGTHGSQITKAIYANAVIRKPVMQQNGVTHLCVDSLSLRPVALPSRNL